MNVWLGNYIDAIDTSVYERQRDYIKEAIETYGTDHISGVTVGNEFMLKYVESNIPDDHSFHIDMPAISLNKARMILMALLGIRLQLS